MGKKNLATLVARGSTNKKSIITGHLRVPSSYIVQLNIILQSYIYPYLRPLKSILSPIQYPDFYIPQFISPFPCSPFIFHHFSPLLSIHLFHCGNVENFVETKHALFPIPHDEFLLNPEWEQNPNFSK